MLGNIGLIPSVGQTFVIVLAVAALHLLFSSNTVTGSIIMPILIALAQDLGLDVWTVAAPAAFTSSLAFILVTETPTNVVPYSAGYFSIRDHGQVGCLDDPGGRTLSHLCGRSRRRDHSGARPAVEFGHHAHSLT